MVDTPKKARGEGLVNRSISGATPDFSAWDHKPGDLQARQYLSRGTTEASVLDEVNQPSSYEELSDEAKAAVHEWISRELRPSDTMQGRCSHCLKHIFERLDGFYVTNGAWKGAMLVAGYEPVDRTELNWQFRYETTDPNLYDRSLGRTGGREKATRRWR